MEWSRADMLDYNVQIVLKKVHFFEENPVCFNYHRHLCQNRIFLTYYSENIEDYFVFHEYIQFCMNIYLFLTVAHL